MRRTFTEYATITGQRVGRQPVGAVHYAAPLPSSGVTTLMHVGNYEGDGVGDFRLMPDFGGCASTVGAAALLWAAIQASRGHRARARDAALVGVGAYLAAAFVFK